MLFLTGSPAFANCTDNLTGTPPASAPGVTFTAGANSADGTAVSVISAITHDVHLLEVQCGGISATNSKSSALLDVLIDPAGGSSWASLIDDLLIGFTPPWGTTINQCCKFVFPIYIKSGTSLGVRCRTAHTADITTGRVIMRAWGNPRRPDVWWCGTRVETLGVTAASSVGTAITPGGQAWGSWTSVGSTTTARYGAVVFSSSGGPDSSAAAANINLQWGAGSVQKGVTIQRVFNTSEVASLAGPSIVQWCDIPSGTQMQVRAASSAASPETIDVALHGVY